MSWTQVKLEEVFDIARGGSPRPISEFITNDTDGLNWISIKDASNSGKYIAKTKQKIRKEGLIKSRLVKPGDFLLTNSMSFGRPYIMKTTGCIHDGWLVLSGDLKRINQDYFYYLLGSDLLHAKFSKLAAGAVVKNLNISLVKGVEIPLPPLAEQKKIAAILDAADRLRQKDAQLIAKYNALSQSLFLDMFGDVKKGRYETKTLEGLFGKGEYGAGAKAVEYNNNSPRYVRITDIDTQGTLNTKRVSSDLPEKDLAKYTLKKGDLLFARSGATVGKTYLYHRCDGDLVYAGYLIKFSIKEPFNAEYFFHFTKTAFYKAWIQKIQNVVAQPNINAKQYGQELNIPIPPIALQNQFAELIQAIEAQKQQAQASLQKSEDLFNSLLQRAFKGELTA